MDQIKILVVDDEESILELLDYNLMKHGYTVTCVETGEEALRVTRTWHPDLLLLDLMLPGVDGLDVCKKLKQDPQTAEIPIIMLTAKGEETDIVVGLELGADDYVTKPFSVRVLLARVKAILRRQASALPEQKDMLCIDDLTILREKYEVHVQNKPVQLTLTEFKLLNLLASRPGRVYTRNQIIDTIHGGDYPVTDRSVDVQVVGLRKKLGVCGKFIETVRGVGYRFKSE